MEGVTPLLWVPGMFLGTSKALAGGCRLLVLGFFCQPFPGSGRKMSIFRKRKETRRGTSGSRTGVSCAVGGTVLPAEPRASVRVGGSVRPVSRPNRGSRGDESGRESPRGAACVGRGSAGGHSAGNSPWGEGCGTKREEGRRGGQGPQSKREGRRKKK